MEEDGRKRCSRCRQVKSVADFARKCRTVYQPYCRTCRADYKQEHYARNKAKYVQGAGQRKEAVLSELRQLEERPCADCSIQYPYYVMDFDHREGVDKEGNITSLVVQKGYTRERI